MIEKCVICGGSPDEEHHLHPQHLGGAKESATVWLCGTHHAKVHKVANRLFRGKVIAPEDDGPWLKTKAAIAIIERIVYYMRQAEEADLSKTPSRIIIKLPKEKLRLIHRRKQDRGFSSLEKYILSLVDADLPG